MVVKRLPVALAVAVVLLGYLGYGYALNAAREGWNLVPIVVVAVDVDANATITTDMVAQRAIPSQFANANVIRPAQYSFVIGQKVLVGLRKGDPLRWTQFELPSHGGSGPGSK
jgi:Flp pilus assembly protein CpaB